MIATQTKPKILRGSIVGSSPRLRVGLALLAVATLGSQSTATEVTATASTDLVQVAEPFTLDVTVTASDGTKVTFPAVTDKIGDFDVRDSQDAFDVPVNGARTWMRHMTLESITTGELQIPSFDIQVNEAGKPTLVQTPPVNVRVASVLEDRSDPTKFRDIQSVFDVDVPIVKSNAWVWWSTCGVSGLALFALIGMISRRNKWLTPSEWAIEELSELETSIDASAVDSETAAQKISEVVRSYLLLQFGIADAGCTPQELVQEIVARRPINAELTQRLNSLFMLVDKARFAGLALSTEGLKSAVNDSRELVQQIASDFESSRSRRTLEHTNANQPVSGENGYDQTREKY